MINLRTISLTVIAAALVGMGAGAALAQNAADSVGARVMVPNQKPAKEGDRVAQGYVAPRLAIGPAGSALPAFIPSVAPTMRHMNLTIDATGTHNGIA